MSINDVEIEPGRHTCPACPRRFEVLSDKKRHVKTEHPRKKDS